MIKQVFSINVFIYPKLAGNHKDRDDRHCFERITSRRLGLFPNDRCNYLAQFEFCVWFSNKTTDSPLLHFIIEPRF